MQNRLHPWQKQGNKEGNQEILNIYWLIVDSATGIIMHILL